MRISVPVMSAGMRSGVNWMRWKVRWKSCATDLMRSVFARPGRAGDEAVAAGEHADEQLVDDLGLADDDFAQLGTDAPARLAEAQHGFHFIGRGG